MVGEHTVTDMFAVRDHPHLVLRASSPPRPRFRERTGGGRRALNYPDRERHATDLLAQAAAIRVRHQSRSAVLGVDPECVFMLDLHRRVPVVDVERAGLTVIEASDDSVMVAFPTEPEMTAFVQRCEAYRAGPTGEQERAPYEELLDGIERARPLTVDDVLERAAEPRGHRADRRRLPLFERQIAARNGVRMLL